MLDAMKLRAWGFGSLGAGSLSAFLLGFRAYPPTKQKLEP